MSECIHGISSDSTCSICKNGPAKPKILRRPSQITKHRILTCRICRLDKQETKFLTVAPPPPEVSYRDDMCRSCNQAIVASKKEFGGTRIEAENRIALQFGRPA